MLGRAEPILFLSFKFHLEFDIVAIDWTLEHGQRPQRKNYCLWGANRQAVQCGVNCLQLTSLLPIGQERLNNVQSFHLGENISKVKMYLIIFGLHYIPVQTKAITYSTRHPAGYWTSYWLNSLLWWNDCIKKCTAPQPSFSRRHR